MGKLKTLFWLLFLSSTPCALYAFACQEVEVARTPTQVQDIVYARPFVLSQGYRWSSTEPETQTGVIVVLRVDPELVVPRNEPTPILYAGDRMLHALNFGHTSGFVIGLIPGEIVLSETPFWFGSANSPGRMTRELIRVELTQAQEAGVRPFSAVRSDSVMRPTIEATNLEDLLRGELADLVLEYAPDEGDLARKWRLPEATVRPDTTGIDGFSLFPSRIQLLE